MLAIGLYIATYLFALANSLCNNAAATAANFMPKVIDIQTSTQDWNHPVFRAGSLFLEVAISSNLSPED